MNMLVNIDVPDLPPAIAFYCDALGLKLVRLLDKDVAELSGAACRIFLLQKPTASDFSSRGAGTRHYTRHWTPVHLDFVVTNLADAARRAQAAGAVRESDCIAWRGSECITFSDPFGHGFCLIQFENETYIS